MIDAIQARVERSRPNRELAPGGVEFARTTGVELDPWQATLLRSPKRQLILNCSRQAGKSTVSSILALHTALYEPGALVLLLAPALRQSQELFRKIKHAYAALGRTAVGVRKESALELELDHGSRIVCLPGKEATIRGFSDVALLIVDEASRVADALYYSIRPMLAVSGGRLVLLSTPFGKRGFFHKEWTESGLDWERAEIRATQVPRIPPEWLAAERARIGDWWYRQEYGCEFLDTTDQIFSYEVVMAALSADVEPLFGGSNNG